MKKMCCSQGLGRRGGATVQAAETGARPLINHVEVRPDWLAMRREDILEPDLPIIDPHHHLWDRSGGYFTPEFLADAASGHRIEATVFVQCHFGYRAEGPIALRPVGETEFAVRAAAQAPAGATRVCAGIVGFTDLQLGDAVEPVLLAHIEAGQGRFKGVRRLSAQHAAFDTHLPALRPHLLADAAFRRGYAHLARLGLSFDAWVYHTQIADVTALARAFPDTRLVLDHMGSPLGVGPYRQQRAEVFKAWRSALRSLADCPRAHVKLGGLAMAINGFDFHGQPLPPSSEELALHWRPYVETCIEFFGVERCMFESNFPVDKGMCSYPVLWNAFKRIASGASATEKAWLFRDTAARFYGLMS